VIPNANKSITITRQMATKAATATAICAVILSAGACKQKSTGISMLRANDSFPAPFSATLSASPSGWSVQIGDGGSITGLTVSETSYVTSATKMPGISEGAQTSGAMSFTANINYTFQFNVTKDGGTPVLCETSYAAPLNYQVEKTFIKCNSNFNASPNGGPSTPESASDADSDKTMGRYISENTVAISDALMINGRSMSPASIARWETLETKVKAIIGRYGGNGAGASADVTYTIQADVRVTDANTVAAALIAAYGGSSTRKVCSCMVTVCTAGECSVPVRQAFSSITDLNECTAKSGTIANSNSDPSSLFNDQMTTTEYLQCSMQ
jgi:hypothetical protein